MHYITTKRGSSSRYVTARADGASTRLGWSFALDKEDNHLNAAVALCEKLGWSGTMVAADIDGGFIFTFTKWRNKEGKSSSAKELKVGGSE